MARRFGWKPDVPDIRDRYMLQPPMTGRLPTAIDLSGACPPVMHQGEIGSCTAHAIAAAHLYDQMRQGAVDPFLPSRLFVYYAERDMEGTTKEDCGAMIRTGFKVLVKLGAPREELWPYDQAKFAKRPPVRAYRNALSNQALVYARVPQTLRAIKTCLARTTPVVFGFAVYESFESDVVARSGDAPMPEPGESSLGGHAVLAVGYDDATERVLCMNSWGTDWGRAGFFTLPYAYVADRNLADDFWALSTVEVNNQ